MEMVAYKSGIGIKNRDRRRLIIIFIYSWLLNSENVLHAQDISYIKKIANL